jgi:hypothetical protein
MDECPDQVQKRKRGEKSWGTLKNKRVIYRIILIITHGWLVVCCSPVGSLKTPQRRHNSLSCRSLGLFLRSSALSILLLLLRLLWSPHRLSDPLRIMPIGVNLVPLDRRALLPSSFL